MVDCCGWVGVVGWWPLFWTKTLDSGLSIIRTEGPLHPTFTLSILVFLPKRPRIICILECFTLISICTSLLALFTEKPQDLGAGLVNNYKCMFFLDIHLVHHDCNFHTCEPFFLHFLNPSPFHCNEVRTCLRGYSLIVINKRLRPNGLIES